MLFTFTKMEGLNMSNEPTNYKEDDVNKRIQEVLDLLTKASPVLFSEEYMCKAEEISGKRRDNGN